MCVCVCNIWMQKCYLSLWLCALMYIQRDRTLKSVIYVFAIESEGQGTFLTYQPSAY